MIAGSRLAAVRRFRRERALPAIAVLLCTLDASGITAAALQRIERDQPQAAAVVDPAEVAPPAGLLGHPRVALCGDVEPLRRTAAFGTREFGPQRDHVARFGHE